MNFSISAWSTGLGLAFNITENIRLNAGFMYTIYDKGVTSIGHDTKFVLGGNVPVESAGVIEQMTGVKVTKKGAEYKDVYKRTSISWGLGLDLYFGKRK